MKKLLLFITVLLAFVGNANSQLSITLAPPAIAAPWTFGGSNASTVGGVIQLTPNAYAQGGRVYYNTSTNITACGSFTVDFDFQIIPPVPATNVADGLTFFFVNPLSGFVTGNGLGLPTNPNGFVLAFDTWNNGSGLTPLAAAYGYPAGFVGNYVEGSTLDLIGSIYNNHAWIVDGLWHHVNITYYGGLINVYFNGSAIPSITGIFPITTPGWFGFTASTGLGGRSTQSVRNIAINSNTISPITGTTSLCLGATTTLTDPSLGTWSSSNSSVATINPSTGFLSTVTTGTTTITYSYSGACLTTSVVTVNPIPVAITGTTNVCVGQITNLTDVTTGGTWSTANTTIATVVSATGVVTGVALGNAVITYSTGTGCTATTTVTVSSSPGAISGTTRVCTGSTTTLSNTIAGGTWSSGSSSVATIGSGSGVVSGTTIGTTTIIYSLGAGCSATTTVTVAGPPGVTISGTTNICSGGITTTLSDAIGGTWSSSSSSVASVGSLTGLVTSGVAGTSGTTVITYSNGCGTPATTTFTVTSAPGAIFSNTTICSGGSTTTLSDATAGGTWSSSTPAVASVGSLSGIVTGGIMTVGTSGTTVITYSNGCGTAPTATVTVIAPPANISGSTFICSGAATNLSDATNGTWSSSLTTVATVTVGGVVTGGSGGSSSNTSVITYSNACGSSITTVTVTAIPGAITGLASVCSGSTIILSNAITGGTWSSGTPAVATVTTGPIGGGDVTGVTLTGGTSVITYSNGCGIAQTTTVTVNSHPTIIAGATIICLGGTTTLSNNGIPTGTWSSSNTFVATINPITGVVYSTGSASGTTVITATNICGNTTMVFTVSSPTAITGIMTFCQDATTTLSNGVAGGTWSSGNPSVATTTGLVNDGVIYGAGPGVPSGCAPITYTLSSGCFVSTVVCTTPSPQAIIGLFSVCAGSVTCLTDVTPGGVWTSITTSVATVATSGCVTGVSAGTSVIDYTIGTCAASATVTVSPLPLAITGPPAVCVGSVITLSDATPSGYWTSSNTNVATIDPGTGDVYGVSPGTSIITFTLGTGCYITRSVTVNALPAAIAGNTTICYGQTTLLSDASGGGVWSSSNSSVAVISLTGVVSGSPPGLGGQSVITFSITATGCIATTTVTVTPLPGPITGATTLCTGATSALTDAPGGGTWSSSNGFVASIDINSGFLTAGTLTGTTSIIYTLISTGCTASTTVTVNQTPGPITGNTTICAGLTTTLSDAISGGGWSSGTSAVATIDPVTGVVHGGAPTNPGGTTLITYTRVGCSVTTTVAVNPLPGPILGPSAVCVGSSIALTDNTVNGTWSSSNGIIAPIGLNSGVITGFAPGGNAAITGWTPLGCIRTVTVTVNPLPTLIGGNTTICAGLTTTLNDGATGGTWSSNNTLVATVTPPGGPGTTTIVTGGSVATQSTATVTYTLVTGCIMTTTITVNPLPAPITGATSICSGNTTQLSDITPGGVWSSNIPLVAIVGGTGLVTGGLVVPPSGPQTTQITYSLTATGCITTTTVMVNPLPTVISGNTTICAGLTTMLSNGVGGGAWSSNNILVATVIPGPGATTIVTGAPVATQGTATVTYTLGSGCIQTKVVTVNPLPLAITGNTTICSGLTTMLSDATPGGIWSSATSAVATIGSGTGLVTGGVIISPAPAGHTVITYSLTATGCITLTTVTVNPLPLAITGANALCQGTTINLSDPTIGGTWSSSNSNLATIIAIGPSVLFADTTGGIVGVDTITYTLGTGCITTRTVTINLQPYPITGGPLNICNHSCAYLSDATGLGVWTSGNIAIATVDPTGLVCGSMPGAGIGGGTTNITYSIGTCRAATSVFINTQPAPITGITHMCSGATTTLSDATPGGGWSSSNLTIAIVGPAPGGGLVSGGVNPGGVDTITYTMGICSAQTTVTVYVQPGPITGVTGFCNLSGTTLSDAVPGGLWTSSNTNNAIVGSASGIVTGVMLPGSSTGTAIISYTEIVGGCYAARTVTINQQPIAITGNTQVCVGLTTQLSDGTGGGMWSVSTSSVSIATVNSTGLVTGLSAGTAGTDGYAEIIYTIGSCSVSTTVTVHPLPSPMTGAFYVCLGSQTTIGDLSPGGTWSSNNLSVATIGVITGIAYGNGLGTTTITYTMPTGCITTHTLSVIAVPGPILGSSNICTGMTLLLSDVTNGGVWTSSNTNTATIGSGSGIVLGVSAGTVVISYTLGSGCSVIAPVVVNPYSPITGTTVVCVGQTINLSDTTIGGVWSSTIPANATVNAVTGVVHGVHAGTTTIIYTLSTGCASLIVVTILPLPAPITGIMSVCDGLTTTLSDISSGGVWSSSNPGLAAIDPLTGVVTAGPSGITTAMIDTITYYQGGCPQTTTITVNPISAPIIGNTNICVGLASALSDATPGGIWTSSNTGVATIDATGLVTSVAVGITTIIYTPPTRCMASTLLYVNPLPTPIIGDTVVCVGSCIHLSDATSGGAWFSNPASIASIGFVSGIACGVSAGTAVITYQIITGCIITESITVNPLPSVISGSSSVCVNATTHLFSSPGGTWTSSNPGVATIDSMTGWVTGISAGTTLISYTIGTGCARTLLMTVNPLPAPITGINTVCAGMTTNLSDATSGGTWSSSNTFMGTVNVTTGVAGTGSPGGSFIVTYILPTGCYDTTLVTINTPPVPISGPPQVCVGSQITLYDAVLGGVWTSSNIAVATIGPVTPVVTGVLAGVTTITYTMGGGNCFATYLVTVNPLPAPITGITSVCKGLTTILSDATAGGIWSSGSSAIATVDPSSGIVTGVAIGGGTTVIIYTLPTTCAITTTVTVNPLPAPITGNTNICLGGTRTLSDSSTPGTWSSSNPAIAPVGLATGVVFGNALGIDTITYTLSTTGCIMTTTVAVHPLPGVFTITGGGIYCSGMGGVHVGLSGSQIGVDYLLYLGSTPVGTYAGTGLPLDFGLQVPGGTYTVVAINTFTTCSNNMTGSVVITVTPSVVPSVSISTGVGDTVCSGTAVTFTATAVNGGAGPAYQWSVNGLNVATGSTYNYFPANGDVVKVVLTSNAICPMPLTAVSTLTMTVITPALPSVGVLVSPNDTVCVNTPVTFTAVPSYGGTSPVYLWMVNNVKVATGTTYTYMPVSGDIVYCRMVSNYRCRLADTVSGNTVTITVVTPVVLSVRITASPGSAISVGERDTLRAVVTNGISPTYQWFVNGVPVPGATTATYISNNFSYPKEDSVGCIVTNGAYCREQAFGWIYIAVFPVGVTQVTTNVSDINVIPNPNNGSFTIKGSLGTINDEEVTIELTDVLGQVLFTNKIMAKGGKINKQVTLGNTIANGMYILNVRSDSEHKVFHVVIEQ